MNTKQQNKIELSSSTNNKEETLHIAAYQGPLPPPQHLEMYEKIHAGLANRIVILAEAETKHRHEIDKLWVNQNYKQIQRGQLYGLIIGITGIITGATTALLGSPATGSIIGGATAVGLVSAFVLGKKIKSNDH